MPTPLSIQGPGGYVPVHAICFGAVDGVATPVEPGTPLPTAATIVATTSTPIVGTATGNATSGPFTPQLGRIIWLTLAGSWSGTVQLLRSVDGGATRLPLTVGGIPHATFTANCNEPVAEETVAGATYYLAFTLTAGTVTYQVAQ